MVIYQKLFKRLPSSKEVFMTSIMDTVKVKNQLEQLKTMTKVVADTGDFASIALFPLKIPPPIPLYY